MYKGKVKRISIAAFLVLLTLSMSGCWDKVEIDRRAIVLALGIDKYAKKGDYNNRFLLSYSFPNSSTGSSGGSSQGGGQGKPKFDISVKGRSFFDANRNVSMQLDKTPYYADAKTVIFGQSLLRDPRLFKYTLDVIMRQSQFSRTASYMGTDGEAKKIIKSTPEANPFVGAYVSGIISNNKQSLKYPDGSAMRILGDLVSSGCTVMPRVIPGKKTIRVSGCYIIKDYRMAGKLTGNETKGLLFLTGQAQGGEYSSSSPQRDYTFEIYSSKVNKKINLKGAIPSVDYNIVVNGSLAQYYSSKRKDFRGKIEIGNLQKDVSLGIKHDIRKMLKKVQDEYKVDVIGLGDYISKHYPEKWRKVQKNWNEMFSRCNLKIKVKTYVDSLGSSQ